MDSICNAMRKIINKCDICVNGDIISKELLLTTFAEFISSTIEKEKHNVGIVLHTGSVCFDALVLAYAAISDILYNNIDAKEVVHSLNPGDLVLYYNGNKANAKAQRYTFIGFANSMDEEPGKEGKFVILEQGPKSKTAVLNTSWSKIVPYLGNSNSMDGRGLRRDNGKRYLFFKNVLEMKDSEIPRTIDASTVVVMSRDISNELINGLSFKFEGNEIQFTELVTASYFTESEQEHSYGCNPAKVEPVIKVTSKISVARKLMFRHDWNRNIGIIVLGDESLRRGESEIPELIERKSIQYVYICMHIDSENAIQLLTNYDRASLFACTKDFLLSNSIEPIVKNRLTGQLAAQINAIIDREISTIELPHFIEWQDYRKFKKSMLFMKSSDYDTEEKDKFIIQAYSLMNLFLTAVFRIQMLDVVINDGIVENVEKPEVRLRKLSEYIGTFPKYLNNAAEDVVSILESAYISMIDNCEKENELKRIISENCNKKIAIIVPKAYYITILKKIDIFSLSIDRKHLNIITANRFNNTDLYDLIIVVGNITGTRFDIFRCRSAQNIVVLLYEAEKYQYKKKANNAKMAEHAFNKRSTIVTIDELEEEYIDIESAEIEEMEKIDVEMTEFIANSVAKSLRYDDSSGSKHSLAEIIAIARFETGEVAFFTKNYMAYILDETDQTVKDVMVNELVEDDTIVFTRSTSKTRDIVDGLLREMISKKLVGTDVEDDYNKSKVWKTKLIDYMNSTGTSAKKIAETMIKNGVSVQEITIRGWLDEDSHTVGPRHLDSIQQIALIAGDDQLFDNAEVIFTACAAVRKVRRRILDAIAQAILGSITGGDSKRDPIVKAVSEQVKDLAVILQVESISFVNESVPINMTNHPVNIE